MYKNHIRTALRLLAILLALFAVIEVLAYATYALAGAGDTDWESLAEIEAPERQPRQAKAVHAVGEWPADRPRDFE